ncbi:MAG: glycosyltransferase family 4 protein [Ignavibacteriales bacterium]|nr:glycosyltransferase family 4 protein [Ignavibacteriales bacterium]
MHSLVSRKFLNGDHKVVFIPNWADLQEIAPSSRRKNSLLRELEIGDKFVIQYLGNMGRTHGIEHLFEYVNQLSGQARIHFLFIGSGAKKQWLEDAAKKAGLRNISILPYRSRAEHAMVNNACDLAIISMLPGMSGVSAPSRLYNIMAAGKPVLVVAEDSSELAKVVFEESIGWVVEPGNTQELVAKILKAAKHPKLLRKMGMRARAGRSRRKILVSEIPFAVQQVTDLVKQCER